MGVYDLETMKAIRKELPGLLLYGEAWAADQSPMPEEQRAVKRNISQLQSIAAFNDDFRDALKGNHSSKKTRGFVSGLDLREEAVKFGVVAAVQHPEIVYDYVETSKQPWASQPEQCINYASCHDNYTLWDKLKLSNPKATDEELRKMVKLAGALVLTSQGIPFLHSGVEFCRTKGGNPNSYKSPDSVNQINWNQKKEYHDVFEYYQKLILLRKNHPAFRMTKASQIQKYIHFCMEYKIGVVSYCIDGAEVGDSWKHIALLFNGRSKEILHPLPEGKFRVVVNGDDFIDENKGELVSNEVKLNAVSMMILVKTED
jgi:pullulanase